MTNPTLGAMTSEAARATWQYRAIERTRAHKSQLGCIILAMLGYGRDKLPRYGSSCTIGADGIVRADAWNTAGQHVANAVVAPIDSVLNQFNYLADDLKLTDAQRVEMFTKLRGWVFKDERVKPEYTL